MLIVVVVLVVIVMLVVVHFLSGRRRSHFGCRRQRLSYHRGRRSLGDGGLLGRYGARVGSRGGLGGGQRTFFHAGHKGGHQLRQVRRGPSHSRGGGRCRHHWHALGHNLGRRSYHRGGGWRFRLVGGVGIGLAKGGGVIFGQEAGHIATVNSIDQG
jgi:hypothetical protein